MIALTDADKREIGQVKSCTQHPVLCTLTKKWKHFVFGFHGHEISEDAKILIRDYHVG